MKNLFLSWFTASMLLATVVSAQVPTFNMTSSHANQAVRISTNSVEAVELKIKDTEGVTLHSARLNAAELDKKFFNLTTLPYGQYTVIMTSGVTTQIESIAVNGEGVKIEVDKKKCIYAPSIKQLPGYVDMNMLCLGDVDVTVRYEDASGHDIFTQDIGKSGVIEKRFNLLHLQAGQYRMSVHVTTDNYSNIFIHEIEIAPQYALK